MIIRNYYLFISSLVFAAYFTAYNHTFAQNHSVLEEKELQEKRGGSNQAAFCYEISAGLNTNGSNGSENSEWVPGLFLGGAAEYHKPESISARAALAILDDFDNRQDAIDEDRDPEWFEGMFRAESLSWQLWQKENSQTKLGWRFDTNFRENTPTSVERSLTAILGTRLRIQKAYNRTDFQAGVHGTFDELDDDLPRTHGAERSDLKDEIWGLAISALAEQRFIKGIITRETVQVLSNEMESLFETRMGAALDIPLQTIAGGPCCGSWIIRLAGEQRFFDLDERSDLLPFDKEASLKLEVIKYFGVGSNLNYGY